MSRFLGSASGGTGGVGVHSATDISLMSVADLESQTRWVPIAEPWKRAGFSTPWWPGLGGIDATGNEWLPAVWYQRPEITRGQQGRLGFVGVTRDVYGTMVPGATVKLFHTSDDLIQASVTSGADGSYIVTTPHVDGHYLVANKDDTIDTAGATVNTLIPA